MEIINNAKLKLVNGMPWTKWPLKANIWKLYDSKQIAFAGFDQLRPYRLATGNEAYMFRKTHEVILPPQGGMEDKNDVLNLVQTGDGAYKFATVKMDEGSQQLVLTLKDDEQVKFIFAKKCEDAAKQFQAVAPWYNTAIVGVIVTAIVIAIMYVISTSSLRGVDEAMGALSNTINANTQVLNHLSNTLNSTGITKPPV